MGSDTGSMASSAWWAKWSSNSNMSEWAMPKGIGGKTRSKQWWKLYVLYSPTCLSEQLHQWNRFGSRNSDAVIQMPELLVFAKPALSPRRIPCSSVLCWGYVSLTSSCSHLLSFSQLPSAFGKPLTGLWNAPSVPSFKLCIVFTRLYLVPSQYSV